MSMTTLDVINNHLRAFPEGIDPIMEDFSEESVIITAEATYRGLEEVRSFFTTLIKSLPEGFMEAIHVERLEVADELAILLWEAKPWLPFCTDTFLVRNGKIVYQTFAAYQG